MHNAQWEFYTTCRDLLRYESTQLRAQGLWSPAGTQCACTYPPYTSRLTGIVCPALFNKICICREKVVPLRAHYVQ